MFDIKRLSMTNFKSFAGDHELVFDQLPNYGLIAVTGKNLLDPELGANGVGKSNLFAAIYWALYDRDPDGLRAGNIVNWAIGKKCCVTLETSIGTIVRKWSPNSLTLDGDRVTQDELVNHLGASDQAFLYRSLIGQFTTQFLDLTPADKMAVLSEVIDVDKWIVRANKAKTVSIRLQTELDMNSRQTHGLDEKAKQMSEELETLKAWAPPNDDLEAQLAALTISYDDTTCLYEAAVEQQKVVRAELQGLEKRITEVKQAVWACERQLSDCNTEIQGSQWKMDAVTNRMDELKNMVGTVCPTCEQVVPETSERASAITADRNKQRTQIAAQIVVLQAKYDNLKKTLVDKEQTHKLLDAKFTATSREAADLNVEVRTTRAELDGYTRKLDDLMETFKRREAQDQNRKKRIAELQKRHGELMAEVNAMAKRTCALTDMHQATDFWEKGFKQARLIVLDSVTQQLSRAINNYLPGLGLEGWRVSIITSKETGAGTMRPGLDLMVDAPHVSGVLPFKAWCGGERGRLRLAGTLGLSDFIAAMTGQRATFEFWDEPTAWLSTEGVESLVRVLSDRAELLKCRVFVADHRDFLLNNFAGTINIVRGADGTSRIGL